MEAANSVLSANKKGLIQVFVLRFMLKMGVSKGRRGRGKGRGEGITGKALTEIVSVTQFFDWH